MLKRTAPKLVNAMGEQAALVEWAHFAALVRVARGLQTAGQRKMHVRADSGTNRFELCKKK